MRYLLLLLLCSTTACSYSRLDLAEGICWDVRTNRRAVYSACYQCSDGVGEMLMAATYHEPSFGTDSALIDMAQHVVTLELDDRLLFDGPLQPVGEIQVEGEVSCHGARDFEGKCQGGFGPEAYRARGHTGFGPLVPCRSGHYVLGWTVENLVDEEFRFVVRD